MLQVISIFLTTLLFLQGMVSPQRGITTSYGYDLLGRLSKLTNDAESRNLSIQHDAAGRPSRTVELSGGATLTTNFGHDLASNLIHEEMPNGCELENTFDPAGRITRRSIRNPNGPLCQNAYQYDLLSNVTRIEETSGQLNLPQRVITNRYNERRQLVEETSTRSSGSLGSNIHTQHQLHRYDAAENRSSTHTQSLINGAATASHSRAFVYGDPANGYPSNQLHQLTETPGAGNPVTTTYTYDANGNRSTKTFGNATDTYSYDAFNRLTQFTQQTATPSENGTWHYRYDPLTRRIARKATGQNPYLYAFNGTSPAFEWQGALPNTTLIKHTGGGVSGRLYTQDTSGITSHPYHNIRGDITAEFSTSGTMTLHRSYDADGLPEDQSSNPSSSYGPNGKWQEPGGLSNEGHRYRDRHTATFLTPDPAGFIDGPNTYNYARHNPWSSWDPNGLAGYSVPGGTTDIGYTGPPAIATVTGITTDPDGGIPTFPIGTGSGTHHPTLNDLLPDFEQYSAWVEDGTLEPTVGKKSPHDLSIAISSMDAKELQQLLSFGGYSPEEKSRIEQQSQSASDAEHDLEIFLGTGEGILWILSIMEPTPFGETAMGGKAVSYSVRKGIKSEGYLIHLTDAAGEAGIGVSNSLRGSHGIFSVPSNVAAESTAIKVARTGLTPDKTTNFVYIPEAANSLFIRPVPVGPYSAWKYFGGVRYAPAGSINMSTGAFSSGGSLIGPRTLIYGPDALFYGGAAAIGGAYYYEIKE